MSEQAATKDMIDFVTMVNPHKISIKKMLVSQEDYNIYKKGLNRFELGNRWFIFFENNWLYFHLIADSIGIYKAEIKEGDGELYIDEFFVERSKERLGKFFDNFDDEKKNRTDFIYLLAKLWKEHV